jgi:hypothetical protein
METTSNTSSSFENQNNNFGIDCMEFHPTNAKFSSQIIDHSDSESILNTTACETVEGDFSKLDMSSI